MVRPLMEKLALGALERCTRTRFFSLYQEMCRLERLPAAERRAAQSVRLAQLLRHVGRAVPFWREAFERAGLLVTSIDASNALEVLRRLPVLTKQDFKSGFPDQVTSQGARDEWRYAGTAGTTDRVLVINDFVKRDHVRAVTLRTLHHIVGSSLGVTSVEVPPHACNVVCGLADEGPLELGPYLWWALTKGKLWQAAARADLRGRLERRFIHRRTTLPPLEAQSWDRMQLALDDRLERIHSVRPMLIRGLPIFLLWLAERARERGLEFPGLRALLPYGGLCSHAMAERITTGFRAPFYDVYGTSEVGDIACERSPGGGLEVYQDLFVVEILDSANRLVEPGTPGKVVLTDLSNFAMPIVRYEVGDWGQLEEHADGRLRLSILGRDQENLHRADEGQVPARSLLDCLFSHPDVLNGRIEESEPGSYVARVMSRPGLDGRRLGEELGRLLGSRPVRVRSAIFVRPEPSGKFKVAEPLSEMAGFPVRGAPADWQQAPGVHGLSPNG